MSQIETHKFPKINRCSPAKVDTRIHSCLGKVRVDWRLRFPKAIIKLLMLKGECDKKNIINGVATIVLKKTKENPK